MNDRFDALKLKNQVCFPLYACSKELIRQYEEEKNKVSARLSEDEQLLQADNDWLVAFTDAVKGIARD